MTEVSKSLVQLTQDYNSLMQMILEAGGELTPEAEASLSVNTQTLALKADAYDFIMGKLDAEEGYWKAEADKYQRVARACSNARERMRGAIKAAMIGMDMKEVLGERATFKLTAAAPKLVIQNEKLVPGEYVIETVVREVNKDKIKASLKEGHEVPGCTLEPVFALRSGIARKTK